MEETAEDILGKYLKESTSITHTAVISAMKEIADKAWEAAGEYEYRSNFGKVPTDVPSKETFMKELFK